MSEYRTEVGAGLKEARWTFFKGMPLFLMVIVFLSLLGFVLNSLGLFGWTIVERKVFENSFQYSEARKSEIATFEAQIAEINRKLYDSNLDVATRTNLEAHASALRIQLNVARSK